MTNWVSVPSRAAPDRAQGRLSARALIAGQRSFDPWSSEHLALLVVATLDRLDFLLLRDGQPQLAVNPRMSAGLPEGLPKLGIKRNRKDRHKSGHEKNRYKHTEYGRLSFHGTLARSPEGMFELELEKTFNPRLAAA